LSQLAVEQDVAAKVMCDNLQALTMLEARGSDELPDRERINRAYAHAALKPLLPALLMGKNVAKLLRNVLKLIAKQTYLHQENLSKPRKPRPKPHKLMTQKTVDQACSGLTWVDFRANPLDLREFWCVKIQASDKPSSRRINVCVPSRSRQFSARKTIHCNLLRSTVGSFNKTL
jgi:hypothetical protein